MEIIDITVPIHETMPVWPEDPHVTIRQMSSIQAGDHTNVSQIRMSVHTGTHIDAPFHFIENGLTVDEIPLSKLIGEAVVVEIPDEIVVITAQVLKAHPMRPLIETTEKILFHTRNSRYWQDYPNEFQRDYVGLDPSAAEYIAGLGVDLVGIDYLSIAPFKSTREPHQILLQEEIVLLEGIDLTGVMEGKYFLSCSPLNILHSDGAPARALLIHSNASDSIS